jgi:kynurenine formamidase
VLIDVSDKVENKRDFELEREDIKAWEDLHGRIPDGSVVLFRFGWSSRYYYNRTAYFGFESGESSKMNFPGKLDILYHGQFTFTKNSKVNVASEMFYEL